MRRITHSLSLNLSSGLANDLPSPPSEESRAEPGVGSNTRSTNGSFTSNIGSPLCFSLANHKSAGSVTSITISPLADKVNGAILRS